MNKDNLHEIMIDQKDVFNKAMHLIDRDIDYSKFIGNDLIVIISGIRRCGKSSLLYLIKERMELDDSEFCYFNFDDERIIPDITIFDSILKLHYEIFGKEPVFFFDEIQNIFGWEKFINRMYEKGIKVFVTGSNAKLLSSEISTSLTGRNKVIHLFPFSFREFLRFKENSDIYDNLTSFQKSILQKDFAHYLQIGGFPLVVRENDLELINNYFQDILFRDIIARFKLNQVNEIKQIALFFASNIGKIFSYSSLQKISGIKSLSSVKDYLGYYEHSYLFSYLKKYDFSIQKQIMNSKKVYTIDTAIAARLGFNFSENKGRLLENIVYIELLRRGKEVFYFRGKNECDFLVKEGLRIQEAIQVSWSISITNHERELNGLLEVMKEFKPDKGILLINDDIPSNIEIDPGIEVIHVWKWLLKI